MVLFPEDHLTAGTIRKYGEYMREHKFRWALVVLFNERPTRLAVQAVAALLPKAFIEYVAVVAWLRCPDACQCFRVACVRMRYP